MTARAASASLGRETLSKCAATSAALALPLTCSNGRCKVARTIRTVPVAYIVIYEIPLGEKTSPPKFHCETRPTPASLPFAYFDFLPVLSLSLKSPSHPNSRVARIIRRFATSQPPAAPGKSKNCAVSKNQLFLGCSFDLKMQDTKAKADNSVLSSLSRSALKASTTLWDMEGSRTEAGRAIAVDLFERYVFPVVAEANRVQRIKSYIRVFEFVYIMVQVLFSGYFLFVPNTTPTTGFTYFLKAIFFGFIGRVEDRLWVMVALIVVDFATLLFLIFAVVDCHVSHEYRRWIMFILRYWHGHLFNCLLIPNMLLVMLGLAYLGNQGGVVGTVFACLGLVCGVYTGFHYQVIGVMFSRSPYLTPSPVQSWRTNLVMRRLIVLGVLCGMSCLVQDFAWWYQLLPRIGYVIYVVLVFFVFCRYFPLKGVFANSTMSAAMWGAVVAACLSIVQVGIYEQLNEVIMYIAPLGVFVVMTIVLYFVFKRRRTKISQSLMYKAMNTEQENDQDYRKPKEDEKRAYLMDVLNINTERAAYMYMFVGFEDMCDLFVDWALLRYFNEKFVNDSELLVACSWLVALFPSEIHFLNAYIALYSKMSNVSLINRCLFYQVHRIHIFRQSSASREASRDFDRVKRLTDQAIAGYCKFWADLANPNMEFSPTIYENLTILRQQAEAAWTESLDKYPNNSRFVTEYSRFLLDCKCQFKEAIKWHQNATKIDQGQKMQNDKTFHHFVLTFPPYLKQGIVDVRGTLKGPRMPWQNNPNGSTSTQRSSSSVISGSAASLTENGSDSSDQIDLVEGAKYLPQANLRLALQRAVSNLQSTVLTRVNASSACRMVLSLIYVIIAILIIGPLLDDRHDIFSVFELVNAAQHEFCIASIQVPWVMYEGWRGGSLDVDGIKGVLGPNLRLVDAYTNLDAPIYSTMANLSYTSKQKLNSLNRALYLNDLRPGMPLHELAVQYLETLTPVFMCYFNETTQQTLIRRSENSSTVDYLFKTFLNQLMILSIDTPEQVAKWHNESIDFCEAFLSQIELTESLLTMNVHLSEPLQAIYGTGGMGESHSKLLSSFEVGDHGKLQVIQRVRKYQKERKLLEGEEETTEEEEEVVDPVDRASNFFTSFTPFFLLLFLLPSVIYQAVGLTIEVNQYSKVLQMLPRQDCLNCAEKIQGSLVGGKGKKDKAVATEQTAKTKFPAWAFDIISCLIVIGLIIGLSIYTQTVKNQIDEIQDEYIIFASLRNLVYETTRYLQYGVFLQAMTDFNLTYITTDELLAKANMCLEEIHLVYDLVIAGSDMIQSSVALSGEVNRIRFDEKCSDKTPSAYPTDFYRCISFERVFGYFTQLLKSTLVDSDGPEAISRNLPILSHILVTRLAFGFRDVLQAISAVYNQKTGSFQVFMYTVLAGSIVLIVVSYFIELLMLRQAKANFETIKSLLLRVNPITFVSNAPMVALVYGKNGFGDSDLISAAHAVFHTSLDAMISMNNESIIEFLNPAATTIFGYTPEQMLGQPLKMLINPDTEGNGQLFYTMKLMKSGQSGLTYEAEVNGTRDDGKMVPLKITLLGFSTNERTADSFALMCRDQTEELAQKSAVEEAKKQSENLLLQILPRDIIMRLNRGDKNISFTVPSATIVFMDIEKFSNYSAALSPSEIMQNLGMVFTAYDKLLPKYPLIIKIKLIGDDYMAAAGLFTPDLEPASHANQVVSFALECLDAIEDLNDELDASLQVRVGINTNGPLIAGVLGTDKPLFDIIGDPINVAARLQSTDIPGLAQISQATYDLVANGPYVIEQRGEVELKGKGKQMTYLVHTSRKSCRLLQNDEEGGASEYGLAAPSGHGFHGGHHQDTPGPEAVAEEPQKNEETGQLSSRPEENQPEEGEQHAERLTPRPEELLDQASPRPEEFLTEQSSARP